MAETSELEIPVLTNSLYRVIERINEDRRIKYERRNKMIKYEPFTAYRMAKDLGVSTDTIYIGS